MGWTGRTGVKDIVSRNLVSDFCSWQLPSKCEDIVLSKKKKDGVPTPGWGAVAATSEGVEASQGVVHKCREGGDFIFQERQVDAVSAE